MADRTTAERALHELLEVSPQVEAAILATSSGEPLAASLGSRGESNGAEQLGSLVVRLLDQADHARSELARESVTQCEIATGTGNVFVVHDDQHVVAAVTGNEPTVGLVFYDLKTALRTMRDAARATPNGNGSNGKSAKQSKGAQA